MRRMLDPKEVGGSTPSQTIYPLFVYCKGSQGYFSFTLPSLKPIKSISGFFASSVFTEHTGLTQLSVAASGLWNNHPVIGFVYRNNRMDIHYWDETEKTANFDTKYSLDFYYRN